MRPHNLPLVMLGAGLLWFGWFGFNAGSALGADTQPPVWRSSTPMVATGRRDARLAARRAVPRRPRRPPWVPPPARSPAWSRSPRPVRVVTPLGAIVVGLVAGAVCALAVGLKYSFGYDDSLDVVGVHLVGGLVGTLAHRLPRHRGRPGGVDGLFYGGGVDQLRQAGRSARWSPCWSTPSSLALRHRHRRSSRRSASGSPRRTRSTGIDLVEHAETGLRLRVARRHAVPARITWPARRTSPRPAQTPKGSERMKLVTAVIKPHKLDEVNEALETFGVTGLTVSEVQRLRPAAGPHRGLPRRGVHSRPRAEGPHRDRRRRARRRRASSTSSSRPPAPARSVTARSGSTRSTTSSGSAPASAGTTRSSADVHRRPGGADPPPRPTLIDEADTWTVQALPGLSRAERCERSTPGWPAPADAVAGRCRRSSAGEPPPRTGTDVALVAVGGLGRRELRAARRPRPGPGPRRHRPEMRRDRRRALVPDLGRRVRPRPLGAHARRGRRRWRSTTSRPALGLLDARHVAGDAELAARLRTARWPAGAQAASRLLPQLRDLRRDRRAPARRARVPARARPQGGPRRPARRAGAARGRGGPARRRARAPSSRPRTAPARRPRRAAPAHRPAPATCSSARSSGRWPTRWACPTRTPCCAR